MKKHKPPHMVMHPTLSATMWCKHCDATFALPLPMNVVHASDLMNGFVKLHKRCKQVLEVQP